MGRFRGELVLARRGVLEGLARVAARHGDGHDREEGVHDGALLVQRQSDAVRPPLHREGKRVRNLGGETARRSKGDGSGRAGNLLPVHLQRDAEPGARCLGPALLLGLGNVRALVPRRAREEHGLRVAVSFLSHRESDGGGAAPVRDALALDGVVELGHVLHRGLHAVALVDREPLRLLGFLLQRDEPVGGAHAGEPERGARGHLLAQGLGPGRRRRVLCGVEGDEIARLPALVRAEGLLELRGEEVFLAHQRMARKLEPADRDVEAVGPVGPGGVDDLEVDARVRRRDSLEVRSLRIEPPGGPRALHAGGNRVSLAQDPSVVRVEPVARARLPRGARLAHGDVVCARPGSLADNQTVILGRPAGAALDVLLAQTRGLEHLRDVRRAGHLGRDLRQGDGVRRPRGLPRARDEVPAAVALIVHVERGVGGRRRRAGSLRAGAVTRSGHRR